MAEKGLFRLGYTRIKWLMAQDLTTVVNKEYVVTGHIGTVRRSKVMTFMDIYDGSSPDTLQLVFDYNTNKDLYLNVSKDLNVAATILVKGTLKLSLKRPTEKADGKQQKPQKHIYDFIVSDLKVVGKVPDPSTFLPSNPNISLEMWRRHPHLRSHSKTIQSIFRIRSLTMRALQEFFDAHDIHRLDPNTITQADCEGAGEMFCVTSFDNLTSLPTITRQKRTADDDAVTKEIDWKKDFFSADGPARLTVSSQLQLEALVHGMSACWTANPSYRAEPSKTTRHVASFTHIEWEIPFIDLKDLMDFSEDLVKHCCRYALSYGLNDLKVLDKTTAPGLLKKLQGFVDKPYQRISYDEAIEILKTKETEVLEQFKGKLTRIPTWGEDLGSYCERFIAEIIFQTPTFVYNYPRSLKSFYMKVNTTSLSSKSDAKAAETSPTTAIKITSNQAFVKGDGKTTSNQAIVKGDGKVDEIILGDGQVDETTSAVATTASKSDPKAFETSPTTAIKITSNQAIVKGDGKVDEIILGDGQVDETTSTVATTASKSDPKAFETSPTTAIKITSNQAIVKGDGKVDEIILGDGQVDETTSTVATNAIKGLKGDAKLVDALNELDRTTVQGCDLLIPLLGELIGSSIREHDYETLDKEMLRRKMDFKPLQWYLDLRKHASVPTGGAGMGFDRLIQILCTTFETNIRDVIPFPVAYQERPF